MVLNKTATPGFAAVRGEAAPPEVFNGIKAQSDPNEMQTPICQVVTEPTADPAGGDIKHTAHLYVLVPMFGSDTNPNGAMACPNGGRPGELCGPALGSALISLFGFVPEAWKTHPAVSTQCPDPNNAVPGTCTMHASSVDLSVLLNATGKTGPPTKPVSCQPRITVTWWTIRA